MNKGKKDTVVTGDGIKKPATTAVAGGSGAGTASGTAGAAGEPAQPQYANPLMKQIEDGTVEVKIWAEGKSHLSDGRWR